MYVQFGYLSLFTGGLIHDIEPIGIAIFDSALVPYFCKGQSSAELQVSAKGEPPDDVPKVQAAMAGEKVLDVARFPRITFRSSAVKGVPPEGASFDATVTGTLTIRDKSQPVTATVHVQKTSGSLTATGRFTIKQTAFGIQPVSVAGVVSVKDELQIAFSISAKAQ